MVTKYAVYGVSTGVRLGAWDSEQAAKLWMRNNSLSRGSVRFGKSHMVVREIHG